MHSGFGAENNHAVIESHAIEEVYTCLYVSLSLFMYHKIYLDWNALLKFHIALQQKSKLSPCLYPEKRYRYYLRGLQSVSGDPINPSGHVHFGS